jgi:hypothetical protein
MAYIIQLASGVPRSILGVKRCTKSWHRHEYNQQFGAPENIDCGNSLEHLKEGTARINKVQPGDQVKPG